MTKTDSASSPHPAWCTPILINVFIVRLRPELQPVPVYDAASAASPPYTSLCVLSDTRSEPDEAEPGGKVKETVWTDIHRTWNFPNDVK